MFIRPRRRGGSKSVSQGCSSVVSGCCNDDRFLENLIFFLMRYISPGLGLVWPKDTFKLKAPKPRRYLRVNSSGLAPASPRVQEQRVKSNTADVPRRALNVGEGSRGRAAHKRWRCSQNELLNLPALWQPRWVGCGAQTAAEPPPPGPALTHKDPCLLQTQEVMCAFMWTRVNARDVRASIPKA